VANLDRTYNKWVKTGRSLDQNGSVPHEIKMYYIMRTIKSYGITTFIESGTSRGDGVAAMLPYVDRVYTVEAWDDAFNFSVDRFKNQPNIDIRLGDSGELLPLIMEDADSPAVFWLDAHYSGEGTAQLTSDTPVVAEMQAISESKYADSHCVIIDDARGFGVWKDYPTVEAMREMSAELFPNHEFMLEGDEIFILPKG